MAQTHTIDLNLFKGKHAHAPADENPVPLFEPLYDADNPADYIVDKPLKYAFNLAIALGQPLLVTGEPGTGKTQLAAAIAHELNLPLLPYYTKTGSTAEDLFYRFDVLRRFQDSHLKDRDIDPQQYVTYQALGKAILFSLAPAKADPHLDDETLNKAQKYKRPTRSVVLIDEIDKAPRDLPNDMLYEIENMAFRVKETGERFEAGQAYRPILILTSNSEKNLPDPFLRRCVFYHIPFPEKDKLKTIISTKFKDHPGFSKEFIDTAIDHFLAIRQKDLKKPPATAELQAWIAVLEAMHIRKFTELDDTQMDALYMSYSVLAKTREDYHKLVPSDR